MPRGSLLCHNPQKPDFKMRHNLPEIVATAVDPSIHTDYPVKGVLPAQARLLFDPVQRQIGAVTENGKNGGIGEV